MRETISQGVAVFRSLQPQYSWYVKSYGRREANLEVTLLFTPTLFTKDVEKTAKGLLETEALKIFNVAC